jgi:hypothetical protein
MTKKQLLIYATEHDIQVVMAEVNLLKPLLFVHMGYFLITIILFVKRNIMYVCERFLSAREE